MKNLLHALQKRATGKLVLILFLITMGVYATIVLYTIPSVLDRAPELRLFDMSPTGYTLEYAQRLLESIGEDGRIRYMSLQLPFDFVYPVLFGLTYTLLLTWIFKRGFSARSRIFYLALVPAFAGALDYAENVGIIIMLKSFPAISPATVAIASTSTVLKSLLTVAFYLLLLAGIIAVGTKRIITLRQKKT